MKRVTPYAAMIVLLGFPSLVWAKAVPSCNDSMYDAGISKSPDEPTFRLSDGSKINRNGVIVSSTPTQSGKLLTTKEYVERYHPFSNEGPECSPFPRIDDSTKKMGYQTFEGNWFVPPQYKSASSFHFGRAQVELEDGKCTFIRLDGSRFERSFDHCDDFKGKATLVDGFSDTYSLINRDGEIVLDTVTRTIWEPKLAPEAAEMSEDLIALVNLSRSSDTIGYANAQGEWVIRPQFGQGFEHHEGLAAVTRAKDRNQYVGFIDRKGKLVLPYKFGNVNGGPPTFSEGLALISVYPTTQGHSRHKVSRSNNLGFIDTKGRWVISPRFTSGKNFEYGLAHVYSGDREYYIDRTGKIIWPRQKLRRQK
jgi:WG containing repeat